MITSLTAAETLSDEDIIRRVLDGEKELYEVIIRRHNQHMFRISRAYVHDADEAEDIVQQAYINAYTHLPKFEQRSKFSTWLTRILINEAMRRSREMGRAVSMDDEHGEGTKAHSLERPVRENPAEETMNEELRRILERTIDALPEKYRAVFVMREIDGMSVAETGSCLAISEANVKVRLTRAKEMLRDRIGAEYRDAGVFEFNLVRCDRIVANVLSRVERYATGGRGDSR